MQKKIKFLPNDEHDMRAIQALSKGAASEAQQIRALKCIVNELAGTYDMSFDPSDPYMTAFNEGRRHVGRAIVGVLNSNITTLTKGKTHG